MGMFSSCPFIVCEKKAKVIPLPKYIVGISLTPSTTGQPLRSSVMIAPASRYSSSEKALISDVSTKTSIPFSINSPTCSGVRGARASHLFLSSFLMPMDAMCLRDKKLYLTVSTAIGSIFFPKWFYTPRALKGYMDTFAHIVIPLLVLLALRIDTRKALIVLPLAVIPDLDLFLRAHRLLFHNVFVLVLLPLLFGYYIYHYHRKYFPYAWIGIFYLSAHLILDLSEGIALLYPLTTDFYAIQANMVFGFWNGIPYPSFRYVFDVIPAEATVSIGDKLSPGEAVTRYESVSDVSTGLLFTIIVAGLMYADRSRRFLVIVKELIFDILKMIRERLSSLSGKS